MSKHMMVALVGLLPAGPVKNALLRRLGWHIGPDVRIGPGLYLRLGFVSFGAGSSIGPFNVLRDLTAFEIGECSEIGQWNWFSAAAPLVRAVGGPNVGRFRMGRHSSVNSRHYLDVSGGFRIGDFGGMAGVRSTVLTHAADLAEGRQSVKGCSIGDRSAVGSNVKFVPGAHVPEMSQVAMGAVVAPGLTEPCSLYRGVPAKRARELPPGKYVMRQRGPLDLPLPYEH